MEPFDSLSREHHLMAEVLRALLTRVAATAALDPRECARFVLFFREYGEAFHQRKEEDVLLPALEKHGFAHDGGPLTHIRKQHQQERELLFTLTRVLHGEVAPTDEALRAAARDYAEFALAHLEKESHLLFPAAAKELFFDDHGALAREVAAIGERAEAALRLPWLVGLGADLARAPFSGRG